MKFIECLLPVTQCNLKCSYCYVVQQERRTESPLKLNYPPSHIADALKPHRLGGPAYISICGAGETLIPNEIVDIVELLLRDGHYINLTNNGTISKRIDELLSLPDEHLDRLHFSFSFHYRELKNRNLLSTFSTNINKVRNSRCSMLVQLNLVDEYISEIDEIKSFSLENFGALPQIALTRDESERPLYTIQTNLSQKEYDVFANSFDSELYKMTRLNFMKRRKEFCYAGYWSGVLNLATGDFGKCYNVPNPQNIFENISDPIEFEAIGHNCVMPFCINSSHFLSLGMIPKLDFPTYFQLRNRLNSNWYKNTIIEILDQKLTKSEKILNFFDKHKHDLNGYILINGSKKGYVLSRIKLLSRAKSLF